MVDEGKTALSETREGLAVRGEPLAVFIRRLLNDVDFLHVFSFDVQDLAVDRSDRAMLCRDRTREIVPVIVFWILANALAATLDRAALPELLRGTPRLGARGRR